MKSISHIDVMKGLQVPMPTTLEFHAPSSQEFIKLQEENKSSSKLIIFFFVVVAVGFAYRVALYRRNKILEMGVNR